MPDLTIASGQDMQQKTADELFCRQHHRFFPVIVGSIQISKSDTVFVNILNPVIGDGDLMGITCQVLDDRIRVFERLFGMYYPIGFIELFLQLPEVIIQFQVADLSSQGQLFSFVKLDELLKQLTPEGLGQSRDMKQEITLFTLILLACSLNAQVSKSWENTYQFPESKRVTMEFLFAEKIIVKTWDRQEVLIKTQLNAASEEEADYYDVKVEESSYKLHIETDSKYRSNEYGFCLSCENGREERCICVKTSLEIFLPADTRLELEAINADIQAAGLTSNISISSINGEVRYTLPASQGIDLDMSTINGLVHTAYQVPAKNPRARGLTAYRKSIESRINGGGPRVELESINGHVYLEKGS